jgi:glycosyltransferase involved in cell wall biosynthesis
MKVCLLNDSFPPVIDGVVNVMMNYADYLMSDHASEVIVGTPRYPGADYSGYKYKVVPYQSLPTAAVTNGYRTGNPFASKAIAEMAAFQPDIIHSHCPASATVIARILREATSAPLVFTYHTKYDIDIRRVVKGKVADETIKMMVRNIEACDDVWVVSRGAGESLKALGFQGDYRVVTNGVDFDKGRVDDAAVAEATAGYDLPEGLPVFLYVGRLMTYKGLPLLLDALKILSDAGQDFRMVFIGKGPDRELLEKKAAGLGLMGDGSDGAKGTKCIFVGPIYDRDKLRAWNTRADLFLFPSTFDTNGLVVREAAACGLASVLIQGSCAAEGITDGRNGFTIEETPEAMAGLLQRVSKDLPHLREVGQHAMDEIYVSWQTCVAEAYDRYQYILEEKRRGNLAPKRKVPSDYLVSLTAMGMEEQEKMRQQGRLFLQSVRETTSGMMQNVRDAANDMKGDFQEAGMMAGQRWNKMKNDFSEASESAGQHWNKVLNELSGEDGGKDGGAGQQWQKTLDELSGKTGDTPEDRWNRIIKDLL